METRQRIDHPDIRAGSAVAMDSSTSERWRQIDRLMERAEQLPAEQRPLFLRQACGTDEALLAEISALLDPSQDAHGPLDAPALELAAPLLPRTGHGLPTAGQALGDYTLIREAGHGGSAAVFLARDTRHDRMVAVKVLYPSVAQSVGRRRFLREVRLAARLQHPHILPVLDSGETGEWLWFAMPWLDGDSLAHRLARDGRLPVADALRITLEIAGALDYAHRQDVLHRDVKPGNILLADGHALLADFGIARARDSSDEWSDQLTADGMIVGTPAYMSPEQAGAGSVDGRSDVYSLACALFEMLTGQPPFMAASVPLLLARRMSGSAPSVRTLRPDLSEAVERVLARALAREPSGRFGSAREFAAAIETLPDTHSGRSGLPHMPTRPYLPVAVLLALAVVVIVLNRWGQRTNVPALDRNTVAILPFQVAAIDSALRHLDEGMVDLLYARLTGEAGLRAVDPRAVLNVWHGRDVRSAADPGATVARRLGAGQLVRGQLVQMAERLSIAADLVDVTSGVPTIHTSVEGPVDSLGVLVDRLSSELLALHAGEAEERLPGLRGYSWRALRAYIAGRAAQRDGRYSEAREDFARGLQIDSTFALAAVGQLDVSGMVDESSLSGTADEEQQRRSARELAYRLRTALSPRDRTLLEAELGPGPGRYSTVREDLARLEAATRAAPDRPEPWAALADELFHAGPLLDEVPDRQRAAAGFERALGLDSNFALAHEHLIDLATEAGDTARVRRLTSAYLARHPNSELADYIRWRAAVALGDDSTLARIHARMERLSRASLQRIAGWSQVLGVRLGDADAATAVLLARAGNETEGQSAISGRAQFLANRGRLTEAFRLIQQATGAPPWLLDDYHLLGMLHYGMDTAGAGAAARHLEEFASSTGPAPMDRLTALCTATRWRVSTGDTRGVTAITGRLRALAREADSVGGPRWIIGAPVLCAEMVDAMASFQTGGGRRTVARLDSILRSGPPPPVLEQGVANLVLSDLLARQGDLRAALAASRRRWHNYITYSAWFLPAYLRQEARLAETTGDRAGAIRAYQHFLALVTQPDPILQPTVRQVRSELSRLLGEAD